MVIFLDRVVSNKKKERFSNAGVNFLLEKQLIEKNYLENQCFSKLFLHWIQSVNLHFLLPYIINGSPYICDS